MFPCRNIACQSYGKRFVEHLWCDFLLGSVSCHFLEHVLWPVFLVYFFHADEKTDCDPAAWHSIWQEDRDKGFSALFLFLTGIFITMSVIEQGLSGIAAVLLAMLPQWIFYLLAFTVYERGRERKVIFVCALLVVLGCLAEGYISPFFLKKVLWQRKWGRLCNMYVKKL